MFVNRCGGLWKNYARPKGGGGKHGTNPIYLKSYCDFVDKFSLNFVFQHSSFESNIIVLYSIGFEYFQYIYIYITIRKYILYIMTRYVIDE